VLRRPFSRRIDKDTIGLQVTSDWANGAQKMVAADTQDLWPESHVFHVHYKALTAAPLDTFG
jgi:hypothetical protein